MDFVVRVFLSAIAQRKQKIQNGLLLRAVSGQADLDMTRNNYRIDWLRNSANKVLHDTEEMIKKYNAEHPNEHATAYDICDILNVALKAAEEAK